MENWEEKQSLRTISDINDTPKKSHTFWIPLSTIKKLPEGRIQQYRFAFDTPHNKSTTMEDITSTPQTPKASELNNSYSIAMHVDLGHPSAAWNGASKAQEKFDGSYIREEDQDTHPEEKMLIDENGKDNDNYNGDKGEDDGNDENGYGSDTSNKTVVSTTGGNDDDGGAKKNDIAGLETGDVDDSIDYKRCLANANGGGNVSGFIDDSYNGSGAKIYDNIIDSYDDIIAYKSLDELPMELKQVVSKSRPEVNVHTYSKARYSGTIAYGEEKGEGRITLADALAHGTEGRATDRNILPINGVLRYLVIPHKSIYKVIPTKSLIRKEKEHVPTQSEPTGMNGERDRIGKIQLKASKILQIPNFHDTILDESKYEHEGLDETVSFKTNRRPGEGLNLDEEYGRLPTDGIDALRRTKKIIDPSSMPEKTTFPGLWIELNGYPDAEDLEVDESNFLINKYSIQKQFLDHSYLKGQVGQLTFHAQKNRDALILLDKYQQEENV